MIVPDTVCCHRDECLNPVHAMHQPAVAALINSTKKAVLRIDSAPASRAFLGGIAARQQYSDTARDICAMRLFGRDFAIF